MQVHPMNEYKRQRPLFDSSIARCLENNTLDSQLSNILHYIIVRCKTQRLRKLINNFLSKDIFKPLFASAVS